MKVKTLARKSINTEMSSVLSVLAIQCHSSSDKLLNQIAVSALNGKKKNGRFFSCSSSCRLNGVAVFYLEGNVLC